MDLSKFKRNITDQFLEEDQNKVTVDGDFRLLETYDSLTGMSILTIIEDEYNVVIPINEYRELNTIKELYDYVMDKKY